MAVIVNRLTKIRYFFPIKTLEIGKFADRFLKRVYSLYRALKTIILDKGMQFVFIF